MNTSGRSIVLGISTLFELDNIPNRPIFAVSLVHLVFRWIKYKMYFDNLILVKQIILSCMEPTDSPDCRVSSLLTSTY